MKSTPKLSINYNFVGILMVSGMTVSGFWAFGLGDKMFGNQPNKDALNKPSTETELTIKDASDKLTKNEITLPQTGRPAHEQIIKPSTNPHVDQKLSESNSDYDKVKFLEEKVFEINGIGTAYEGSPNLSKPIRVQFQLKPLKNTDLEKFEIAGRIMLESSAIILDNNFAEINDRQITINSMGNNAYPFFNILGTLDEPILRIVSKKYRLLINTSI